MTELLYLHDAYLRECVSTVAEVDADARRVRLDRTIFYAQGGGQPADFGTISGPAGDASVVDVRHDAGAVWHVIGEGALPSVGDSVQSAIDWDRRHQLMRTHTAMHLLCGVIWNEFGVAVTGGNMEPLTGRMDFEFDPLPEGFKERIEAAVNAEIAADAPDRGLVSRSFDGCRGRGPDSHEGQPDSRVGGFDSGR